MSCKPDKAFILAAGMGSRLRPYTDHVPKPMVSVAGRTLIDRTIDRLEQVGVREIIINTHYMADILEDHLQKRMDSGTAAHFIFSRETELLDTGGGVKATLSHFGGKPFYVIAGDALWTDGAAGNALERLAANWDDDKMDIITLMQPLSTMTLTGGLGDYALKDGGHVERSADKTGTHMWTNIRINHPRLFDNTPDDKFSFLTLMDKAEQSGRYYALEHDGEWHHISTPEDLERVNEAYKTGRRYA